MSRETKFKPGDGYTEADWNEVESPPVTKEQLAQGKPFAEVFPELAAKMRRARGPQRAPTKVAVSLRLDRDVLAAYRGTGPGWQARMNDDLRKAAQKRR